MRNRVEKVLKAVQDRDWLGPVAGDLARDLADERHLDDLVRPEGDDDPTLPLRASRLPRVRPILVVLAARAAGGGAADPELQYAAELLGWALTLHDVALGQRTGRRHALARSVLRGVGWLGTNRLLLRAMEFARHGPSPDILSDLVDTLGAFQEGQEVTARVLDAGTVRRDDWSAHADGHTGALFAFCCRAGAHVGRCGEGQLAAFARYGRHLGRMWHIAEDVLLLRSDEAVDELLGRAHIGRPMLPVVVTLERAPDAERLWRRVAEHNDRAAAEALLARMEATRALAGTREVMAQELWAARQAIARFEDTPYRHALERLVSGLSKAPYEEDPASR